MKYGSPNKLVGGFMNVKYDLMTTMFLLCALSACGKKTDAGTPEKEKATLIETANVSEVPNFEVTRAVPQPTEPGYATYLEGRFGSSCQVQRNSAGQIIAYREKSGFDASLRIGDSAYVSTQSSNQEGHRKMEEKYEVHAISRIKARIDRTYLSMDLEQAGGEILTRAVKEFDHCLWIDGQISCDGTDKTLEDYRPHMTTQGFEYLRSHPGGKFESCTIENQATTVSSKVELGQLKLQDGKKIEAFLTTQKVRGPITCQDQLMGEGEMVTYSITSLAVKAIPSMGDRDGQLPTCGGVTVVKSHVVTIANKVIDSYRFEQLKPALK
jgi:predicted small lipoprotein YifL